MSHASSNTTVASRFELTQGLAAATILLAAGMLLATAGSASAAVSYQEDFTIGGTVDGDFSDVGWFSRLTQDGEIKDYDHSSGTGSRAAGVHAGSDYAYIAPKNRANVSNAPALVYTDEASLGDISTLASVQFDVIGDNIDVEYRVAVQVGGLWYASNEMFEDTRNNPGPPHTTGTYVARQYMPAAFEAAANWLTINNTTLGATSDIALGSAPVSDLVGTVAAIGLYLDAGTNSETAGDHIRFDSFVVNVVPTPAALPTGLALIGLLAIRRRSY